MLMFEFNPLTDEELEKLNTNRLFDEGEYEFEVVSANNKASKYGNQMIELKLNVSDRNGSNKLIYDYLVSSEKVLYKVKHFCSSIGLDSSYKAGKLSINELIGKMGFAVVKIKKEQKNDDGTSYPSKNYIQDYISKLSTVDIFDNKNSSKIKNEFFDDEVPFFS